MNEEQRKLYPECAKLDDNWDAYVALQHFFQWLRSKKMTICKLFGKDKEYQEFCPITKNAVELAYEYLGIDATKLERERRVMLEEVRKRNASEKK
ncbi:MAG: hypothetical protein E3J73_05110 [Candidatus Bathyarchaeum sp.]|nr:MAG: hypothetical protein E3J73_05110 [Candidatus Bathyarchaeum sp.]